MPSPEQPNPSNPFLLSVGAASGRATCPTFPEALEAAVLVEGADGRLCAALGDLGRFGWAPGDLVGHQVSELCDRGDVGRWGAWLAAGAEGAVSVRLLDGWGAYREVRARRAPLVGADDRPAGALFVLVDSQAGRDLELQLIAAQRMEVMGLLTAGIAHDFNNLVSLILSYATMARSAVPAESLVARDLDEVVDASRRAAVLVRQLMSLGRRPDAPDGTTDVGAVVSGLGRLLHRVLGEHIRLEVRAAPGVWAYGDEAQIEQVVMNLVMNARDALAAGGTLELAAWGAPDGRTVLLSVRDTGTGMTPSTAQRIFEPFFSTKGRAGTGLGLTVTRTVVEALGGEITCDSAPGAGSVFVVRLPACAPAAPPPPEPSPEAHGRRGHVLVVEDEEPLRELIRRVLTSDGYTVTTVGTASAALEQARALGGAIDVLLLDRVLPDSAGPQLGVALLELSPGATTVYMSGYPDGLEGIEGAAILPKPFEPTRLLETVRAARAARR